jgi:hypothetical protein
MGNRGCISSELLSDEISVETVLLVIYAYVRLRAKSCNVVFGCSVHTQLLSQFCQLKVQTVSDSHD